LPKPNRPWNWTFKVTTPRRIPVTPTIYCSCPNYANRDFYTTCVPAMEYSDSFPIRPKISSSPPVNYS
jgi:hypothetical protein